LLSGESWGNLVAMKGDSPIVFGCAGLGGYAAVICELLEKETSRAVKLGVVCEPDHVTHAAKIADMRARGITVCERFDQLLNEPIEAVWLPIPIHLHRPFTEQSLAAGKAVMSEKPAAGSVEDVDAMIAARDAAKRPVAVGFQDIFQPETSALKKKLLSGGIGKVRSARLRVQWPREKAYFQRSKWAGRLKVGTDWVLDSPAQNAMSHYLNLLLFFLGPSEFESAEPVHVEAELYRANAIENYDTCALRFTTAAGVDALVLLTHACAEGFQPEITIHGDGGDFLYQSWNQAIFNTPGGTETFPLPPGTNLHVVLERFANLVRGKPDPLPVATLEMARQHTLVINGVSEAAVVCDAPFLLDGENGGSRCVIPGIENLFEHCYRKNLLPHESGLVSWSVPSGRRDLRNYARFAGPPMPASPHLPP